MTYEIGTPTKRDESPSISRRISDVLFFLYCLGVTAFKSSVGFDYFFCRASFAVLILFEVFWLSLEPRKINSKVLKWYIAFVSFYFISILWGDFEDGMFYINYFIQIVGILFFYSIHVNTKDDILRYYKLLVYTLLISCVIVYFRGELSDFGESRIGSSLTMNANDLGIRFAFGGIICLLFAQKELRFYFIFACLSFFTLSSGSKTALFILLIGFIFFFVFRARGFKKTISFFLIFIFLALIFYLIFQIDELYSVLGQRVELMWNTLLGQSMDINGNTRYDVSFEERSFYIRYAFNMFLDSFFWGYGANGFVTEMRRITYSHVAYSHNTYTEVLATLGLVGGFLYFTPQLVAFVDKGKRVFKEPNSFNALCFSIIVCFLFMEWGSVCYMDPFDYLIIIPVLISSLTPNVEKEQVTLTPNNEREQVTKTICEGTTCEETTSII